MAFQARRVANASRRTAMTGPGSRETQNLAPTGLKWKEIKVHYSLIPLWGVMGVATVVVIAYIGRLMTNRDVNWFKREEPWNYYSDKRWKLSSHQRGTQQFTKQNSTTTSVKLQNIKMNKFQKLEQTF